MSFHVRATSIPPCGIDHAVNAQSVPWNFARPRNLQHPRPEFVVYQEISPELGALPIDAVAFEKVVKYFRLSNIGGRDDLNVIAFQRKVIEVSPYLA
jgi:hypothetical protein